MKSEHLTALPAPDPDCARFAPLLPLAGQDLLSMGDVAALREHTAGCARCRTLLDAYERLDIGLRRHFTAGISVPHHLTEAIVNHIEEQANPIPLSAPSAEIPPARPRRSRRALSALAGVAAVLLVVLLAGLIYATHGHATGPAHRGNARPTIVPGSQFGLTAVSMSGPTEGWALGKGEDANYPGGHTYLLHYIGGKWVKVESTLPGGMEAIKMTSATDGWAAGTEIWHYDGRSWSQVQGLSAGWPSTIAATSPSNVWIGGSSGSGDPYPIIWHYDGRTWTQQPTPVVLANDFATISTFSMISADEGWAVGTASMDANKSPLPPTGFILHYTGGDWRLAETLPSVELFGISMGTTDDGWAGGRLVTTRMETIGGSQQSVQYSSAYLLHYTNGRWAEAAVPTYPEGKGVDDSVGCLTMFSPNEGWMVANIGDEQMTRGHDAMLGGIFHYENGHWTEIERLVFENRRVAGFPGQNGISFVSPSEFWIAGGALWWTGIPNPEGPGYQPTVTPLIAHYKDGVWSIYED